MTWLVTAILKRLIFPPLNTIVLAALGLVLLRRWPRLRRALIGGALVLLYALATPVVAELLSDTARHDQPLADAAGAQAIVILGAGLYRDAPEYGGDTVSTTSLVRLRYGAKLHRETGLPILVTGGKPLPAPESEAHWMRAALEREFGVAVRWVEEHSTNTRENAEFSRAILAAAGIDRILLVTTADHMPRATSAFERVGFQVIPAATLFGSRRLPEVLAFLPSAGALHLTTLALHELVGRIWYGLLALWG
jgi:uncharacterized SAM-binding protein YcdF (DUF218 family)